MAGIACLFLLAGPVAAPAPVAATAGTSFSFTNFGSPSAPGPFSSPVWDVQVHNRSYLPTVAAMDAQHGADCSPFPNTHPIQTPADSVFVCKNHVMTAINSTGYGEIVLTPAAQVDFSNGPGKVDFHVTTFSTSLRDWIDLWVSPFSENLALPYYDNAPDLQGPPRDAINIRIQNGGLNNPETYFSGNVYRDFTPNAIAGRSTYIESMLPPSEITRTHFLLEISRTHIRFGMPDYKNGAGFYWIDSDVPDLGWSQGVVQFVHHSYNPMKAGLCLTYADQLNHLPCAPDTWHWSDFAISPSQPFTIIKADQTAATVGSATVTFPQAAPPNSYLRFAGTGNAHGIQVSFDGGKTWQPAQHPNQAYSDQNGTTSSYWMPIPSGQTSVTFRQTTAYEGHDFYVRDISIWTNSPNAASTGNPRPPVSNPQPGNQPPPVANRPPEGAGSGGEGIARGAGVHHGTDLKATLAGAIMPRMTVGLPVAAGLVVVLLAVGLPLWKRRRNRRG